MKVISAAVLLCATVLVIHTRAAHAQQPQPAPDQSQYPPGYAPPPGYTPPPGYAQPAPPPAYGPAPPPPPPSYSRPGYYPPPPPPPVQRYVIDRTFMFGGSLGLAGLYNSGGYSDYANSYALRAGFGLAPRLMFLVGFDGAWAVEANLASYQNIWYAGVQAFLSRQLFLRGGLGLGNSVREDPFAGTFADVGFGATGTIGYELIQGYNWSLEMAGVINAGFYEYERWVTYGMNLGINFF